LFLALQQPVEVPGVRLGSVLREALVGGGRESGAGARGDSSGGAGARGDEAGASLLDSMKAEAAAIGFDERFLDRPLNVDLSGGERKRNEVLQLAVLRPAFCVLDEIDSGLDVDALGSVSRRIESATREWGLGVLAITHFQRLLVELRADFVHVMVDGKIVASGGPELATELEDVGYGGYGLEA